MSKHTPGPWEMATNDSHTGSIATVYCTQPKGAENAEYTDIWSPRWMEGLNPIANARLIAKAPEMYVLLKRLVAGPQPTRELDDTFAGLQALEKDARTLLEELNS